MSFGIRRRLQSAYRRAIHAAAIHRAVNHWRFRNSRNICFVWVPKTAGTSIYEWLHRETGMLKAKEVHLAHGLFPQRGPVTFGHMDYRALRRAGVVSPAFHQSALRFSFVRNPFDRAVSLYYFMMQEGRFQGDFPAFVTTLERGIDPIGLYNIMGLSQCNPQTDWLFNDDGTLTVDHLFKMENLPDAVDVLANSLGVRSLVLHANSSRRSSTLDELFASRDLRKRVARHYRRDFELLGYDPAILP